MILALLLILNQPVMAEGELEMFEEICEVTGEVRRGFRLRDIKTQTLPQVSLQSPSEQQNTF
jgi:hypothetical protein